jgi:negative regulator of sigma-B (phosphoserine phosphatase)
LGCRRRYRRAIDPPRSRRASPEESILQCGGTVGMHLPSVLSQTHSIAEGDVFMLVSDGIRHGYRAPMPKIASVAAIAADILKNHGRDQDDAIVLVGRVGDPP